MARTLAVYVPAEKMNNTRKHWRWSMRLFKTDFKRMQSRKFIAANRSCVTFSNLSTENNTLRRNVKLSTAYEGNSTSITRSLSFIVFSNLSNSKICFPVSSSRYVSHKTRQHLKHLVLQQITTYPSYQVPIYIYIYRERKSSGTFHIVVRLKCLSLSLC